MFQLKLTFELENPFLPKETDRLMVSYMKAAVSESQEFYESLYDKKKSILKGFCFSYSLPQAKFRDDKIYLAQNSFTLYFSDENLAETIRFLKAFQKMQGKKYPMNGNSMTLVKIQMLNLQKIKDSRVIIKMQSPLLVRKHNSTDNSDMYYTWEQEAFSQVLKENVELFLQRRGIVLGTEGFSVRVIKGKKVVVPVFGRNTDANLGFYELTGSPELLNVLYLAGLGVRRSEGHGKWELIG